MFNPKSVSMAFRDVFQNHRSITHTTFLSTTLDEIDCCLLAERARVPGEGPGVEETASRFDVILLYVTLILEGGGSIKVCSLLILSRVLQVWVSSILMKHNGRSTLALTSNLDCFVAKAMPQD